MLKVATAISHEPYREYKDVERVYSGSTEIDKILDKNGNVLFAVNKEVEGTPALTYKGKEETNLKNYRIYGQTVDGESVGDRTANLFDISTVTKDKFINAEGIETSSESINIAALLSHSDFIAVPSGNYITMQYTGDVLRTNPSTTLTFCWYNANKSFITRTEFYMNSIWNNTHTQYTMSAIVPEGISYCIVNIAGYNNTNRHYMLNEGSTALPYEPYGYRVPVKVEGKNLANNNRVISDMYTVSESNNYLHIVGTNTSSSTNTIILSNLVKLEPGIYDLVNNSNVPIHYDYINKNNIPIGAVVPANSITTITYPSNVSRALNLFKSVSNGSRVDAYFQWMLVKRGDNTTIYEPYHTPITTNLYLPEQIKMVGDEAEYVDYKEQKQHRVRKNLLQNTATSQTINGVTFTVNEDGSVTCNGTASNIAECRLAYNFSLPAGNYCLTGIPPSGSASSYFLRAWYSSSGSVVWINNYGNGCNFTLTDTTKMFSSIVVWSGKVLDNITFYPMIRKADIADNTYEPYIENTDLDVTLPALPVLSGTNGMSVGTEVQPSNVYMKGRIKEIM